MYDIKKKYWFTIEPYVFATFAEDSVLLYNTLDSASIEVSDAKIIALIREVYDEKNCGVAGLEGNCLVDQKIANFISELRDKFMGDIIDTTLSSGKPIQLFPMLNLQSDVARLKSSLDRSVGEFVMRYLQEVTVHFISEEKEKILPLAAYSHFFNQISIVAKIQLFNIQNYPESEKLINILTQTYSHKEICLPYNEVISKILPLLPNGQFSLKIFVNFPIDINKWKKCLELISEKHYPFEIVFSITSEKDYERFQQIMERYNIDNYQLKPKYTGENFSFFEENMFLSKEDILENVQSLREIFAHQALNTFDFGKITVLGNGDVYANSKFPILGNITTHTIQEMLYKEMNEGQSWLRIRNQTPCNDCIYQWLCPSPSDYELEIGKPNLCHIKP